MNKNFMLGLYAVIVLVGVAAVWVQLFSTQVALLLFALTNGLAIVFAGIEVAKNIRDRAIEKGMGMLPERIDLLGTEGDHQVVAVYRRNGEMVVVNVPEDYDPNQDDAELIIRQSNPELFPE